ncbi:hypothetical protein IQ03_02470 [Gemmobacter caeni]|uniref:Minor tail protein Z (GPZ) n=1 Tax=Gemmobacter caeni TaxID=589035 RepID=A0A2T6AZ19_9RHOB|nr:hypothetical protein [Gemmobacter caeni]PTX49055.1 hypothetical protein C8N34_108165 [Gemmobacter caeni]TWI98944.1 hypothetical protein IQ03_02470 [Gemmobacter caeni]
MEFAVVLEAFPTTGYIADLSPDQVATAARMALNKIADRTRTRADRALREQIAFPAAFLGPSGKRLWVQTKASNQSLQAVIRGRGQTTSLARFAGNTKPTSGKQRPKGGGVQVQVKAGGAKKFIERAFIMQLRGDNRGLAVRTKDGMRPRGAYVPKEIGKNLWLLYGPSVDQALINSRHEGIYEDLGPEVLDALDAEFRRLIDLRISDA